MFHYLFLILKLFLLPIVMFNWLIIVFIHYNSVFFVVIIIITFPLWTTLYPVGAFASLAFELSEVCFMVRTTPLTVFVGFASFTVMSVSLLEWF